MCKQFIPINIIRNACVIYDEIYLPDDDEFKRLSAEEECESLDLKEILMGTNDLNEKFLTKANLDKIAGELSNKFKLVVIKDKNSLTWNLNGVRQKSQCNDWEKKSFDKPTSVDYDLIDPIDPQGSLPTALRFHVDERIRAKFNHLVVNLYKSLRENNESYKISAQNIYSKETNHFTMPRLSHDFENIDAKSILNSLKTCHCCL